MSQIKFNIMYDVDVVLDLDQIWPDGDAPEDPSVEDVYEAMFGERKIPSYSPSITRMLDEWDCLDDGFFEVRRIVLPPKKK